MKKVTRVAHERGTSTSLRLAQPLAFAWQTQPRSYPSMSAFKQASNSLVTLFVARSVHRFADAGIDQVEPSIREHESGTCQHVIQYLEAFNGSFLLCRIPCQACKGSRGLVSPTRVRVSPHRHTASTASSTLKTSAVRRRLCIVPDDDNTDEATVTRSGIYNAS